MNLNKAKCEILSFGEETTIQFMNGEKVKHKDEVKYLGCHLNNNNDIKTELNKRLGETSGMHD